MKLIHLTPVDSPTEPGGTLVGAEMERRNVERLADSFGFQERDAVLQGLFGCTIARMRAFWARPERQRAAD